MAATSVSFLVLHKKPFKKPLCKCSFLYLKYCNHVSSPISTLNLYTFILSKIIYSFFFVVVVVMLHMLEKKNWTFNENPFEDINTNQFLIILGKSVCQI